VRFSHPGDARLIITGATYTCQNLEREAKGKGGKNRVKKRGKINATGTKEGRRTRDDVKRGSGIRKSEGWELEKRKDILRGMVRAAFRRAGGM